MSKMEMDKEVISIVNKINELGYNTKWFCSGTIEDHPSQDATMLGSRVRFLCYNISNQQLKICILHLIGVAYLFSRN